MIFHVYNEPTWDDFETEEITPENKGVPYVAIQSKCKIFKKQRLNEEGDDMYLRPDGTVYAEIDIIKKVQRTFIHNYYKPDGTGAKRVLERLQNS